MPFVDLDGRPLDRVPLLYRGGRDFQLESGFAWIDPRDGTRHEVAPHDPSRPASGPQNGTDLASVPPFLWGLVASYGRQTLPAILHDRLVDAVDTAVDDAGRPATPAGRMRRRDRADGVFRRALEDAGLPRSRATVMWCAVRVEGYWRHRRALGALLVAQLALGVAAVVAAVVLGAVAHPLALLLLLAPAPFALAWGRQARFMLPAAYLAALYSPLVIAAALASGVEYLVALLLWLGGGRTGATPRPGPTIR
ncbi:DUF1353 domain-containing protein [Schumannella soli]|uniref:DUF1353 domain-containing protein n=1 Tax=Schumannella soli TaxID=2590779 RepID=A0A506Y0M4_9MICO|nr:DUF1353 domain-containing protein [Schumannella soli]TPW74508.1 DUF1353 domain-containing protein [Schumannella soli]